MSIKVREIKLVSSHTTESFKGYFIQKRNYKQDSNKLESKFIESMTNLGYQQNGRVFKIHDSWCYLDYNPKYKLTLLAPQDRKLELNNLVNFKNLENLIEPCPSEVKYLLSDPTHFFQHSLRIENLNIVKLVPNLRLNCIKFGIDNEELKMYCEFLKDFKAMPVNDSMLIPRLEVASLWSFSELSGYLTFDAWLKKSKNETLSVQAFYKTSLPIENISKIIKHNYRPKRQLKISDIDVYFFPVGDLGFLLSSNGKGTNIAYKSGEFVFSDNLENIVQNRLKDIFFILSRLLRNVSIYMGGDIDLKSMPEFDLESSKINMARYFASLLLKNPSPKMEKYDLGALISGLMTKVVTLYQREAEKLADCS